jgi:dTDP-4-amino-4,6-dideoxygalactose transaminase
VVNSYLCSRADVAIRIPLYDTVTENRQFAADFHAALDRVLASGRFVLGNELGTFESALAQYCGTDHAVGLKSGTDALILTLEALGIGAGDEVITTPFTFFASVEAIMQVGAKPVFADIEPGSLCLSPDTCAAALTPATKAVLLVHVFGHCANIKCFQSLCEDNNVRLVEDAAQAIGSTWNGRPLGSFGAAGTFSFYPTKNLGALGDAGAVVTSDTGIADSLRQLRSHGRDALGRHACLGYNSHMDELQAAFLHIKLGRLDAELARRRELAARYDAGLPPEAGRVHGADGCVSNYHQYAIRTDRRDTLRQFLVEQGIGTGDYYPVPAYREPAFAEATSVTPQASNLPETERACKEVLTLPVRPSMTDEKQRAVIDAVRRLFAGN